MAVRRACVNELFYEDCHAFCKSMQIMSTLLMYTNEQHVYMATFYVYA